MKLRPTAQLIRADIGARAYDAAAKIAEIADRPLENTRNRPRVFSIFSRKSLFSPVVRDGQKP